MTNNYITLRKYEKEFGNVPTLSSQEQSVLVIRAQAGNMEAQGKLVYANARFVIKEAYAFASKTGISMEDLVNEGFVGLLEAVKNYNKQSNASFLTYASYSIRDHIRSAVYSSMSAVRLPKEKRREIARLNYEREQYHSMYGTEPSSSYLAEVTGYSESHIATLDNVASRTSSLEEPTGAEDDSMTIGDRIRSSAPDPSETVEMSDMKYRLKYAVSQLAENQSVVISRYYGLNGMKPETLDSIGKTLGLTKEAVRQRKIQAERNIADSMGI